MDVQAWLRDLGLERYVQTFQDNEIDARSLPHLTADDLKEMGVTAIGHRRIILRAIAELHADGSRRAEPAGEGAARGKDAGRAAEHEPQAERRQLTVMFVDLVGSTALSAQLDPEDMRDVIRSYHEASARVITRFEGHVAKYMGDGVLAYFGWPRAHEDEPERAIRAGLEITRTVSQLRAPSGAPLAARVGIATGLVVVGDLIGEGASREQAVVGETPNLAARLQGLGEPSQVVIAEATRRLIGEVFVIQELGVQTLKGIAQPVAAFAAIDERPTEDRFEARSGSVLLPMVGREQELALLLERWRRVRKGEGQGVLLVGDAGIGKSRTSRALLDSIANERHVRIRYQCSPHHSGSALWPVVQQLTRAAGLAKDDPAETQLDKVEALLETAGVRAVAPLLADMIGLDIIGRYGELDLTPQVQRMRTMDALVGLLLGLADRQPVLVVVEDAHWIDPTTVELVDQYLDRIADARVLLVVTSRPDQQPVLHPKPYLTRLNLSRLGRLSVEAMVAHLSGHRLPTESIDAIIARTDGVPLFVEELTKAVLEGGYHSIPASLHDSLMARLDRLPEAKEVAQLAACIGREFDYSLLAALLARPEAELVRALDELAHAELLFRRGAPPEATYSFKHALVQDAAYGSLLKSKRRELHARIAEVLEERLGDTAEVEPELLAHHYTGAGLAEPAIRYWRQAGERAIHRSAHKEASAHLARGLELLSGLPETPDRARLELQLLVPLGQALSVTKGRASVETERAYARAWELCREQVGDAQQLLSVFLGLWGRRFVRAEFEAADDLAEQWSPLAERVIDGDALVAITGYMRGGTAYFRGELLPALTYFEEAIAGYDPRERGSLAVRYGMYLEPALACCCWGAQTSLLVGRADQAVARSTAALDLAQQLGHPPSLASAVAWTAIFHSTLGEVRTARQHAEATIKAASELAFPFRMAEGKIVRGWAMAVAGETSEGLSELRDGIEAWRATGAELSRTWWLALMAEACERADQPERGLSAVDQALEQANRTGERLFEAELHRLRGELLRRWDKSAGDDEAERCFLEALAVARRQHAKLFELRAARSLAGLRRDQGKQAEARDLLAPVYGWFKEGFTSIDLKNAAATLEELG